MIKHAPSSYTRSPEEIRDIFDSIAKRYDFLNSFLSFNQNKRWRKDAVRLALRGAEKSILDIGTGTGAFLGAFLDRARFDRAVGVDVSGKMLDLARKRLGNRAEWLIAGTTQLPFGKAEFDSVSSAYVLRSISDLAALFREVNRVLKPKGRFVILELTRPRKPVMKLLYQVYLNGYLPVVGKLVSGSWKAYQFLSSSIQKFYDVGETVNFLRDAGFESIQVHSMTGGICTLVIAEKSG